MGASRREVSVVPVMTTEATPPPGMTAVVVQIRGDEVVVAVVADNWRGRGEVGKEKVDLQEEEQGEMVSEGITMPFEQGPPPPTLAGVNGACSATSCKSRVPTN